MSDSFVIASLPQMHVPDLVRQGPNKKEEGKTLTNVLTTQAAGSRTCPGSKASKHHAASEVRMTLI